MLRTLPVRIQVLFRQQSECLAGRRREMQISENKAVASVLLNDLRKYRDVIPLEVHCVSQESLDRIAEAWLAATGTAEAVATTCAAAAKELRALTDFNVYPAALAPGLKALAKMLAESFDFEAAALCFVASSATLHVAAAANGTLEGGDVADLVRAFKLMNSLLPSGRSTPTDDIRHARVALAAPFLGDNGKLSENYIAVVVDRLRATWRNPEEMASTFSDLTSSDDESTVATQLAADVFWADVLEPLFSAVDALVAATTRDASHVHPEILLFASLRQRREEEKRDLPSSILASIPDLSQLQILTSHAPCAACSLCFLTVLESEKPRVSSTSLSTPKRSCAVLREPPFGWALFTGAMKRAISWAPTGVCAPYRQ